jgi:hypothetical protein
MARKQKVDPFDYRAWLGRLEAFILDLRRRSPPERQEAFRFEALPPLTEEEVEEIEEELDLPLPPPLRAFFTEAAAGFSFEFVWGFGPTIEAAETFGPADEVPGWRDEAVEYAQHSWLMEKEWPLDRAFWRHALPIMMYESAHGTALWVHDPEHPDPAVVGLLHDDASSLIAPTFADFLHHWERLGYALSDEFRDPETGFLDSTTPQAQAQRRQLGWSD